jgi:hypothetical protein
VDGEGHRSHWIAALQGVERPNNRIDISSAYDNTTESNHSIDDNIPEHPNTDHIKDNLATVSMITKNDATGT